MIIWKFDLLEARNTDVRMPRGSRLLCIQLQAGVVRLWAMVRPDEPTIIRRIVCKGTGWEFPETDEKLGTYDDFVGTVQVDGLVWHYFDAGETP